MNEKDEDRARRFCRENGIDYGDSPLAEEFAKVRSEAFATCAAECAEAIRSMGGTK